MWLFNLLTSLFKGEEKQALKRQPKVRQMPPQSPGQQVWGVNDKLALPFLAMWAYTSFLASQIQFPYTQNRSNLHFKVTITQKKMQSFHQCTVNVRYKNHTAGTRSSGSCNLNACLGRHSGPVSENQHIQ